MPISRDWDLHLDVDMVLRGQGADPAAVRARRPALVAIAQRALADGLPLLEPAVVYRELDVRGLRHERLDLGDGLNLAGPLIAQHLGAAQRVVVMVCTIGDVLERYVSEVLREDAPYGLALDGLGSMAVEALGVAACNRFEAQAAGQGLQVSVPLSPGMIGWPVDQGQPQVFRLVDAESIGVTLSSSSQMIPRKSTSMVLGIGRDMLQGRTCDFCSVREHCRYQDHYAPAHSSASLSAG